MTLDGQATTSDAILGSRPWILGFVGPGDVSREMISAIQTPSPLPSGGGEDKGEGGGRLVLIVRADPAAARRIAGALIPPPKNAAPGDAVPLDAAWYADPSGKAAEALGVKGVPALFGVDERNVVRWRMVGPLLKPGEVRELVRKWMNR
jgi:hypothetical protein